MTEATFVQQGRIAALPSGASFVGATYSKRVQAQMSLIQHGPPGLQWTTNASFTDTMVSVYSADGNDVQLAIMAGASCWKARASVNGTISYGVSPAARVAGSSDCYASSSPASGWKPTWPHSQ
jgi:acyl CoA:acetate/3-ketoacid CoA transferase beta subunit